MKTTLKTCFLLLVLATLGSCVKDPEYLRHIRVDENELLFNNSRFAMDVRFAPPFYDNYSIKAVSKSEFFGPLVSFKFMNIPYEMLGKTIDLTEKSDLSLSFELTRKVEWTSSPEGVSGVIYDLVNDKKIEYSDESPFESGKMLLTEDETGITFVLWGVLKNGNPVRMKLFAPAEQ